ncbi:FxsB family cyclophane-forming radical SAM/SPASM peptide maturase [Cryptosporangium sp. NPDC048952]|uniref:FxsB family cyclophane-forming radical SAM/SPASM peptide maturase n=1 Tax=Cryptosporangium sp. NPDC048952 TaxID=3363961 RepID=UPI00370F9D16
MPLTHRSEHARSEWPNDELDIDALVGSGWRPVPITQFILKVHSRCNLACTYCYVYEHADQSWRDRPRRMSEETLTDAARRIGQHAAAHRVKRVAIVFHGGEPLLTGSAYLRRAVDLLQDALPPGVTLDASLQTNGVLLDEATLDVLRSRNIRIGVSIDGTRAAHDRHRRYLDGSSSGPAVERALALLTRPENRGIYAGLLCVIDLDQEPIEAYARLAGFDPPRLDFLLPHGDWTTRPPGRPDDASTPYADWLIPIFERWYADSGNRPGIRLFEEIIQLLIGGRSRSENVGLSPVATLVVETDGAIEQVDTLRNAYAGAAATGLHVRTDSIDAALRHPGVVARQIGVEALAPECRQCRFGKVCGGGFYGHRYRTGSGFRNPSVYCPDLFALAKRIRSTIAQDLGGHS